MGGVHISSMYMNSSFLQVLPRWKTAPAIHGDGDDSDNGDGDNDGTVRCQTDDTRMKDYVISHNCKSPMIRDGLP